MDFLRSRQHLKLFDEVKQMAFTFSLRYEKAQATLL